MIATAPCRAHQALTELLIPGALRDDGLDPNKARANGVISAINLFETMEIYPGSKLAHFKELHKKTGIAYEDMVRRSPPFPPPLSPFRGGVATCTY